MRSSVQTGRVLIVEDDESLAAVVAAIASGKGHETHIAPDGREGLQTLFNVRPDLVVLDLGLPVMNGWDLLSRIRELSDVPVLVLTARGSDNDKVRALQGGADDYVTKPFSVKELSARMDTLMRRSVPTKDEPDRIEHCYRSGALEINWTAREVRVDGVVARLSPLEYQLLSAFVQNPNTALSTRQLLESVWGDSSGTGSERVKFAVLRLRQKLGWDELTPVEAVRGFGYRYRPFEAEAEAEAASPTA